MKTASKGYLYITPILELKETLQKEKEESTFSFGKTKNLVKDFKEMYQHKFLIVVAEPGNGKSRLLKEIVLKSIQYGKKAIYINLKNIGTLSIHEKTLELLKRHLKAPESDKEINEIIDYFFVEKFQIDDASENVIICLDALDEVSRDVLSDYFEKIEKYCIDYPNVQIVLSCRDYIYKGHEYFLKGHQPQLIEIKPFDSSRIEEYLTNHGFSKYDIEKVTDHFLKSFQLSIINSPRVLEIFVSIKDQSNLENALNKSKAELLDCFIYGKLEAEEKKLNTNKVDIIKRVLEKLALTMAIYQRTEITKDELLTFFDDVKSNLNSAFLNQVDINNFLERSLLVSSADGKKIQFHNAEFQEFLAAKEITRLGRTDQVLFDIVVDKTLNEIYPYWTNSIRYVLDLQPSVQLQMVVFICRKESAFNHDLLNKILITDSIGISKLSLDEVEKTFTSIYDLYQRLKWYMSNNLSKKLSNYYVASHQQKLITALETVKKDPIIAQNTLQILNFLFEEKIIIPSSIWEKHLSKILLNKNNAARIKEQAVKALSQYNKIELIKKNIDFYSTVDSSLLSEIHNAVTKIDPNDEYSIDILCEIIKKDLLNSYSRHGLENITSHPGIIYLLKKFEADDQLIRMYSMYLPDKYVQEEIHNNIRKVYDKKIQNALGVLILNPNSNIDYDVFLRSLLGLIKSKDEDYIFEVVNSLKDNESYGNHWFNYNQIFNTLISPQNVDTFLNRILQVVGGKEFIPVLLLNEFRFSEDTAKLEVFEKSKKYLFNEYAKQESIWEENSKKRPPQKMNTYDQFQYKLFPEDGKYMMDVFSFYKSRKEQITIQIQSRDKERMKELLLDTVLMWDFKDSNFHVTYSDGSKTGYSFSSAIQIFGEAFELFTEFNIPSELYRQKLIEYIPYSLRNDNNKKLFDLIGEITFEEINNLMDFYLIQRTDDLFIININNLFDVVRHYKIVQFVPFLEKIIFNDDYEFYRRKTAMELVHIIKPNADLYFKAFTLFFNTNNPLAKEIIETANKYLISFENKHKKEAIEWRLEEIVKNKLEYSNKNNPRNIDSHEIEYRTNGLNQPLSNVHDKELVPIFLNFLEQAVKLYCVNIKYKSYAVYMWNIVLHYFDNLKMYGSYIPIQVLEKAILKDAKFDGFSLLHNSFTGIKISYADAIGKSRPFPECIKIYNSIKEKMYLSISSSNDLCSIIEEIIELDIKKWVEEEGAYKLSDIKGASEELIQKTLKTQLEIGLLKRGIREKEIRITREEQLLDDKRTDFVISYGFVGQVLIEIKLTKNKDVRDKLYPKKLLQYIDGTKSDFGIFLVFQTNSSNPWLREKTKLFNLYKHHLHKIKIIGMDCTKKN